MFTHFPSQSHLQYKHTHQGPFPVTNYVIPERFLVGGNPKVYDDQMSFELVEKYNFNVFICLQSEYFREKRFQYHEELQKKHPNVEFILFEIEDLKTHENNVKLLNFCIYISNLLKESKVYLHCLGGHGRTGIVASIAIYIYLQKSKPKQYTVHDVLQYIQDVHDTRQEHCYVCSPQTNEQKKQVVDVCQMFDEITIEAS